MMTSDLAGHCGSPPALPDCSLTSNRSHEERAAGDDHDDAKRHQEKDVANDVDDVAPALGKQVVHDVDTDVFVVEQRPGRAKQEDDAEQHPLQFQPGVRGNVEALPDDRVNGGDDDGDEDQPGQALARPPRERIDSTAQISRALATVTLPVRICGLDSTPRAQWPVQPASMKPSHQTSERSRRQLEVC